MDQSPSISKRVMHMIRIVFYMIRKGLSKHKIMMDLNLLFKRGKIAGKAITNLLTFHHHHHHNHYYNHPTSSNIYSAFSCRSMDPNLSFYQPKEIEFSCSNTPSYSTLHALTHRRKNRNKDQYYFNYDAETIAKAFEILNSEMVSDTESSMASPSPAVHQLLRTPVGARQLRITDSPFLAREDESEEDVGKLNRNFDEFINKFYEQLRVQQLTATPEYRASCVVGRA